MQARGRPRQKSQKPVLLVLARQKTHVECREAQGI
jgi:hypothetical protein